MYDKIIHRRMQAYLHSQPITNESGIYETIFNLSKHDAYFQIYQFFF